MHVHDPRASRPAGRPGHPFRFAAAAALVALAACRSEGAPDRPLAPDASASASVTAAGVRLTNPGREPLAYTVFEREFSMRVRFAPCADTGPTCVRLAPGQTVVVPFDQVGGYAPGAREGLAYTWRVVPDGKGGHQVADMQSQALRF